MADPWGTPIQHTAPVANDVSWYIIAATITAGAALLSFGVARNFARWEKEMKLPEWFSIVGELVGVTLGTLGGGLAGHLVWHWGLGLLCGHVGGWASPWIVHWISDLIESRVSKDKPHRVPKDTSDDASSVDTVPPPSRSREPSP